MTTTTAILFSGGSDSTLAAALAAREPGRVVLLTYHHPFMFFPNKIRVNIARLESCYPETSFEWIQEDITDLFRSLYCHDLRASFGKYRTMLIPWICAVCKLAMHVRTATYCRAHGIDRVTCGAHRESAGIFPAQMKPVIERIRSLYHDHGILYETPVYESRRTDRRLFAMGIVDNPQLKDQHLLYSTQHTCVLGVFLHAHAKLYYHRRYGLDAYQAAALQMVREAIDRNPIPACSKVPAP